MLSTARVMVEVPKVFHHGSVGWSGDAAPVGDFVGVAFGARR